MMRRPPRSTRTETLFPYTTVFRSFTVAGGEILGIAGVAGNGQGELLAALAGERLGDRADCLRINGTPAGRLGPTRRRALGLGVVPEERNGHGAVAELSLAENVLLTGRARLGLVASSEERRVGEEWGSTCRSRWSPYL